MIANHNTLTYILINLHAFQRIRLRKTQRQWTVSSEKSMPPDCIPTLLWAGSSFLPRPFLVHFHRVPILRPRVLPKFSFFGTPFPPCSAFSKHNQNISGTHSIISYPLYLVFSNELFTSKHDHLCLGFFERITGKLFFERLPRQHRHFELMSATIDILPPGNFSNASPMPRSRCAL